MTIRCEQCGKDFELTETEAESCRSKGLEPPKNCAACREKNKYKRKRIPLREIASLLGIVLFLILIIPLYGAINHNNPYSSVGKEKTSVTTPLETEP